MNKKERENAILIFSGCMLDVWKTQGTDKYEDANRRFLSYRDKIKAVFLAKWEAGLVTDYEKDVEKPFLDIFRAAMDRYDEQKEKFLA